MIVSFYSYKGGVGRSQLLVNIASCLCFEFKKKVLLIDWDLEAPGLLYFFNSSNPDKTGLIDLLTDYICVLKNTQDVDEDNIPVFNENYIQNCLITSDKKGCVDLVSAGKESTYVANLFSFDWQAFYEIYDGKNYIEWLKDDLREKYDYVFIDSRTGISNYSGIPNIQMPDINVIIVAPTSQNFEGSLRIAKSIRESDYVLKGYRKPIIIPILSRVDPFLIEKVDEWTSKFKEKFSELYAGLFNIMGVFGERYISKDTFINDTFIEYNSELSFGENLLFPVKKQSVVNTFTQKIRKITTIIENINNPSISVSSQDTNFNYSINSTGLLYLENESFLIEDGLGECILFLRISTSTESNLINLNIFFNSRGSKVNFLGKQNRKLLKKDISLNSPQTLFDNVEKFQSLRRGVDNQIFKPKSHNEHTPLEILNSEKQLAEQIYQTFFTGETGQICTDFIRLLKGGYIEELLLVLSVDDDNIVNIPFEITLPLLFSSEYSETKKTEILNTFGLIRTTLTTIEAFNFQSVQSTAAPLKMLFITALPENLDERGKMLQIEEQQTHLIQSIGALEATGDFKPKIVIEFLENASLMQLDKALKTRQHDIVHISGHGAYNAGENKGVLYFENEEGDEEQVSGAALGEVLRGHQCVKLLILSACETAIAGSEGGVTKQAAAFGVPAIIAMRFAVTDDGAKVFTTEFYTRLATGLTVTRALAHAREALLQVVSAQREQSPQIPSIAEWFTPVVYQNQALGSLIDQKEPYLLPEQFYPASSFLKTSKSRLIGEGFIGRKRYLIQMRQSFRAGRHVCLHGLGGLGKTTLAEAFAHNYDNHSHQIIIFRNGNQINEAHILQTLQKRFELVNSALAAQTKEILDHPQVEVREKLQVLIDNYLRGRKTILIFDNVEDVQTDEGGQYQRKIGSAALSEFLKYLCENTPKDCHILFTTRYKMEDLADVVMHLPLDKMGYAEQYRLLNYSEVLRQIDLKDRDDVYKRLDGHPRGYEYLEALLKKDKSFNWQQVAKSEAQVFENLLLVKVYERLTAAEQQIFQVVSIFVSRTPLAALAAVSGRSEDALMPVLQALQDWSLCFLEKDGRFEVHRLTREWMGQHVLNDENKKAWALKAGAYFEDQPTWGDDELARAYYEIAETWDDFVRISFRLEKEYERIGFNQRVIEINQAIVDKNIDDQKTSFALYNISFLLWKTGDYDNALLFLEKTWEIVGKTGDTQMQGRVLNGISQIYDAKGDYDKALGYLEQSLAIQQEIGDRQGEGSTLNNISQIYSARGDYGKALGYLEQSLANQQQIGDRKGEGTTLNNIGRIYDAKGDYDKALIYLEQSLAIRQQIGDRLGEGMTLNNISQIFSKRGDYDKAWSYLEQSLSIQQQIGDRQGEGISLNNLATTAYSKGDIDKALGFLEQSLAVRQQIGDINGVAISQSNIGSILFEQERYEEATLPIVQAYQIFQKIGSPKVQTVGEYLGAIIQQIGEDRFKAILSAQQ